jgi:hypothetical protein
VTERKPRKARGLTTQDMQAAAEGVGPAEGEIVDDGREVEFKGRTFRMADSIGLMPLLKFAHASSQGLDSNDMQGLSALYAMIRDCIAEDDFGAFERHAMDTKAEGDDIMAMVQRCVQVISARPTSPPGDSSAGRPSISPNSKASSLTAGMVSPDELGRST